MISREKLKILTPLQKMPKNVGDLGKLTVSMALTSCQKSNKSPNLVTLPVPHICLVKNYVIDLKRLFYPEEHLKH